MESGLLDKLNPSELRGVQTLASSPVSTGSLAHQLPEPHFSFPLPSFHSFHLIPWPGTFLSLSTVTPEAKPSLSSTSYLSCHHNKLNSRSSDLLNCKTRISQVVSTSLRHLRQIFFFFAKRSLFFFILFFTQFS